MKNKLKVLILSGIIACYLVGCAALETRRDVIQNTFTSNFPDLTVQVSPSFIYVGEDSLNNTTESVGGMMIYEVFDTYGFVEPADNIVSKSLAIQIHKAQYYFISDFFRGVKALQVGKQEISGNEVQYFVRGVQPDPKKAITRLITDKGYSMPHYGLLKVYGKLYGVNRDTLVKIYYYEPLKGSGLERLSWNNFDSLNIKQLDYLEEFNKRADASFHIF